ncbi:MAG TPA: MFS transporter, partial [Verrucomicrobiae bacterium]
FLVTMAGVALVDKKGRKFLLSMGAAGIIVSLVVAGLFFRKSEKHQVDVREAVQSMVTVSNQTAVIGFNAELAAKWLGATDSLRPSSLVVIYSYGDFTAASKVIRSDDTGARIELNRNGCVPPNKVAAFFQNPFANLEKSKTAALRIDHALVTPVPMESTGWLTAICIFSFMAFFAMGPGVCVWLALSELMPTRIRSNGMSIALLINQAVSTTVAIVFLPTVGQHGYSTMFFGFAACTVVYFVTATFLLPETKGKTLEEIEEYFDGKKSGQTVRTS